MADTLYVDQMGKIFLQQGGEGMMISTHDIGPISPNADKIFTFQVPGHHNVPKIILSYTVGLNLSKINLIKIYWVT